MEGTQVFCLLGFFFHFVVQLRLLSCREQQVSMGTAEGGYLAMQNCASS